MKSTKNPRYTQLLPILYVKDLEAEKNFYLNLGFKISYEGDEVSNFIALKYGKWLEFGLEEKDIDAKNANNYLVWQIGVDNLRKVLVICNRRKIPIIQGVKEEKYSWGSIWTIIVKSPNGYNVTFES